MLNRAIQRIVIFWSCPEHVKKRTGKTYIKIQCFRVKSLFVSYEFNTLVLLFSFLSAPVERITVDSAVYLSYNQRLFNMILWVDTIMLFPRKFHLWAACPQNRIPDCDEIFEEPKGQN